MPRTILGQRIDRFTVARTPLAIGVGPVVVPVAVKLDPAPAYVGSDPGAEPIPYHFHLDAYDPAAHNTLVKVTVVMVQVGHGEPADVEGWLASSTPKGSADTSALATGGDFTVPVPDAADGDYNAQVLLTYDA